MSRSTPARKPRRSAPSPPPSIPYTSHVQWKDAAHTFAVPGVAILPLRLFLGVTFVYAAIQKLTDPGFFQPGSSTYIGAQILGYSRGSPIRIIMLHLMEHAQIIGALTILSELSIGLAALLGLFTRLASLGGMLLNLTFLLTASWHTYPYFMGSDIVFVAAWLTLALTGPGALALDGALRRPLELHGSSSLAEWFLGPVAPAAPSDSPAKQQGPSPRRHISRLEAIFGGLAAIGLMVLGLLPRGRLGGATTASAGSGAAAPTGTSKGVKVTTLSQLAPNSAVSATDPKTGDPAIIVRTHGKVYAYDAVCTHAGCTVEYDPQSGLIVCPCHGGSYDPVHNAQVVAGPPPAPLAALPVSVDAQGNVSLTDA